MHVDNTPKHHLSLCTGLGGIDIGLKGAIPGLRTVAYSEIGAFACANLVSKMESGLLDAAPIWTDLRTFPFEELDGVDGLLVSAGFPCQPFSLGGKKLADEDPRHIFPFIKDGISRCRPDWVFLENVSGITSQTLAGDGWADPAGTPVLLHVLREMERIGYKSSWGIFSAEEVGAPHVRLRVFSLSRRTGLENASGIGRRGGSMERVQSEAKGYSPERFGEIETAGRGDQFRAAQACWPAPVDHFQFSWEPQRTISRGAAGAAPCGETDASKTIQRIRRSTCFGFAGEKYKVESEVGGDLDGVAGGVVYAELCNSYSDIQEELSLIGNSVMPIMAEMAIRYLYFEMTNRYVSKQDVGA